MPPSQLRLAAVLLLEMERKKNNQVIRPQFPLSLLEQYDLICCKSEMLLTNEELGASRADWHIFRCAPAQSAERSATTVLIRRQALPLPVSYHFGAEPDCIVLPRLPAPWQQHVFIFPHLTPGRRPQQAQTLLDRARRLNPAATNLLIMGHFRFNLGPRDLPPLSEHQDLQLLNHLVCPGCSQNGPASTTMHIWANHQLVSSRPHLFWASDGKYPSIATIITASP